MHKALPFAALLLALAFGAGDAAAQATGTLTGVVTDSTSGELLPIANIRVTNAPGVGAATDIDGSYTIENIPVGPQVVTASFVGYQTREIPVTIRPGTNRLDIALSGEAILGEGLIVTALGIEREERSLGYSAQEVDGDDINQVAESNVITALSGRVAGANVTQSNALGGSNRIVLRGANSISGNNEPLFVVDGIPLDNSNFTTTTQERGGGGYDYGNAASLVNPQDIASVSVLKGPSAGALYGARAANGVILITTKSGRRAQGLGITINQTVTTENVYNLPPYQNLYGGGANSPFGENTNGQLVADFATDESWGPRLDDGRVVRQWYSYDDVNGFNGRATPWVSAPGNVQDFFQNGVTSNTNIAFAQGGDNFNYRLSLANVSAGGVFPGNTLNRRQVGFNGSLDLSEKLTTSISANYINNGAEGRPGTGYDGGNVFLQFNQFGQRQMELGGNGLMRDYQRPDGSQRGWNWRDPIAGTFQYTDNPYWVRYESNQQDATNRVFGNFAVDYNFTDKLSLRTNVQTDYYTTRREERTAFGSQGVPTYGESIYEVQESSVRTQLNFERDLTRDFSINAFIGGEGRYNDLYRNRQISQGGLSAPGLYTVENSIDRPFIDDYFQELAVISGYGDVTLGYRDLAYINGTLRNDVSSTLPEGENSYLYPSLNLSLVISELGPLRNSDVLTFGKIRAGFARVGNDTQPYRTGLTYPLGVAFGSTPIQALPGTLPNLDLRSEKTTSFEAGAELAFFNSRAGIDATYYTSETTDQILDVEVSRASGYSRQFVNAGSITNSGIELALRTTPVFLDNGFRFDLNFNVARNNSNVEELIEGVDVYTLGRAPFGAQIVAAVGQPYGAIIGNDFVRDANGNKVLSVDDNGNFTGYKRTASTTEVLGSYLPDFTGGISTSLSFKGIQFSGLIDGQIGGDVYSITSLFGRYSGILDETVEGNGDVNIREVGLRPIGVVLPAGTSEADAANTVGTPYAGADVDAQSYFTSTFGLEAAHIFDASFARLRELSLGYTIPSRYTGGQIRNLTVSVVGRNLAILYKKSPFFDPAVALSATNVQGIEAGSFPPTRSLGISVTATL